MLHNDLGEGFMMIIGANQAAMIYEIGVVDGAAARVVVHAGPGHEGPREVLEVMSMPRSVQEILDHADELARRFEESSGVQVPGLLLVARRVRDYRPPGWPGE